MFNLRLKVFFGAKESIFKNVFFVRGGAYCFLHFGDNKFFIPGKDKPIDPKIFLRNVKRKLGVNKIFLSCCCMDKARKYLDLPFVELIDFGNREIKTFSFDRWGIIIVY